MAADPEVKQTSHSLNQTLGIIKPNAFPQRAEIIELIKKDGFTIVDQRELTLTNEQAEKFYEEHKGKGFFKELCASMTSGPVVVLFLQRENAIVEWRRLMGPTNVEEAKKSAPKSLRALYGKSITENAVHGSDPVDAKKPSDVNARRELAFFFEEEDTYGMIKPNAVKHKTEIINEIKKQGLTVVNSKEIKLTTAQAEEFYAEHKGKKFFDELVKFMTSDTTVVLHLRGPGAIKAWRQLMGPTNPDVARKEYPSCLRAKYATGFTENATHGSDSPEAAKRELNLVFGPKGWAS